jgi:hypothetical protein
MAQKPSENGAVSSRRSPRSNMAGIMLPFRPPRNSEPFVMNESVFEVQPFAAVRVHGVNEDVDRKVVSSVPGSPATERAGWRTK